MATTRLSTVALAYRFAIGHPLQYTGLLLATHVGTGLPLSLPHSAEISAFRHALRRQYFVVAIRHVSGELEFVSLWRYRITSVALARIPTRPRHTFFRAAEAV